MSSAPSTQPFRVAFVGIGRYERETLASFMRMAAARRPAYVAVDDLAVAHFIVCDADDRHALATLRRLGRGAEAVFLGAAPRHPSPTRLKRPASPAQVLLALDALVARVVALRLAAQRASERTAADAPDVGQAIAEFTAGARFVAATTSQAMQAVRQAAPPPPRPAPRRALLVGDGDVALRLIGRRLRACGLEVDETADLIEAVQLAAQRRPELAFVDVDVAAGPGGRDAGLGIELCGEFQRRAQLAGAPPAPSVVLLSGEDRGALKVRGSLAGADGFLVKPLDSATLDAVLRRQGVPAPRAMAPELLLHLDAALGAPSAPAPLTSMR